MNENLGWGTGSRGAPIDRPAQAQCLSHVSVLRFAAANCKYLER